MNETSPEEAEILFHGEGVEPPLQGTGSLSRWIKKVVEMEGGRTGSVNVIFCSDPYLHHLNVEHLGHDTYTDVITFDYSENYRISGDIFISIDRLQENSEKFDVPFEDERDRVIIHGVLHLLGHPDKTDEEKKEMRKLEDYYLAERS